MKFNHIYVKYMKPFCLLNMLHVARRNSRKIPKRKIKNKILQSRTKPKSLKKFRKVSFTRF